MCAHREAPVENSIVARLPPPLLLLGAPSLSWWCDVGRCRSAAWAGPLGLAACCGPVTGPCCLLACSCVPGHLPCWHDTSMLLPTSPVLLTPAAHLSASIFCRVPPALLVNQLVGWSTTVVCLRLCAVFLGNCLKGCSKLATAGRSWCWHQCCW